MKEAVNKRRLTAIAAAAAVILAIAGAMAYFSYANGGDGNEHVKAEIVETGIIPDGGADNGTLKRDILPGTSEQRDIKVRLDADTDAFVFLIVKDTVNTNDTDFVTYAIDPGWTALDKTGLGTMNIEKSIDIFSDKASGTLTLAPQDTNTKIYYRVERGTALSHSFTYPVLKDNQISYSSALTNDDVKNIQPDKDISFQTYAIQMEPFCDPNATGDDLIDGAKRAWNQNYTPVTNITLDETAITLSIDGTQRLNATITPSEATCKDILWTSSDTSVATVDGSGNVTAVGYGIATITASAKYDDVSASCEVTVPVSSVSYAVQIYQATDTNNDGTIDTLDFGPATGVDARTPDGGGHLCNNEHCIHNDSWADIQANPENYEACKTAGCTKAVELNVPAVTTGTIWSEDAATMKTTGDGVGVLYYELTTDARVWATNWNSGNNLKKYEDALIQNTLTSLLTYFPDDLKDRIATKPIKYKDNYNDSTITEYTMSAKLYLLNEDDLTSAGKTSAKDKIAYAKDSAANWWLRDTRRVPYTWWGARNVSSTGSIGQYDDNAKYGVAPGFRICKSN